MVASDSILAAASAAVGGIATLIVSLKRVKSDAGSQVVTSATGIVELVTKQLREQKELHDEQMAEERAKNVRLAERVTSLDKQIVQLRQLTDLTPVLMWQQSASDSLKSVVGELRAIRRAVEPPDPRPSMGA